MPTDLFTPMPAGARPRALRLWAWVEAYFERESARRMRRYLHDLDDHLLKDIGLTRADLLDFGR